MMADVSATQIKISVTVSSDNWIENQGYDAGKRKSLGKEGNEKNMGHFGFSYVGLIFLMMLFIPNFIWMKKQPQEYDSRGENKILLFLERTGQVLVTAAALIFSDFNFHPWSLWSLWLAAAFALMFLYECWWIRYFRSKKTLDDFYRSFLGIPVAGAVLPVLAFLLLGVYGKVLWLIGSAALLGIGHIGIHLQHRREMGEG